MLPNVSGLARQPLSSLSGFPLRGAGGPFGSSHSTPGLAVLTEVRHFPEPFYFSARIMEPFLPPTPRQFLCSLLGRRPVCPSVPVMWGWSRTRGREGRPACLRSFLPLWPRSVSYMNNPLTFLKPVRPFVPRKESNVTNVPQCGSGSAELRGPSGVCMSSIS